MNFTLCKYLFAIGQKIQMEHVLKPPTIKTPPYLCILVFFFALKILFIYIGNVKSHWEIQNLFILNFFPH